MSCYNCYSSRKIDAELVDKILERGHKLRSAMVQTILSNDPFNQDVIFNHQQKSIKLDNLSRENNEKIRAYLQGDAMSRDDEIQTLDTLRSMSATDLCKLTDKTYHSQEPCDCLTCNEYREKDLKCDLKRSHTNEITQKIQERYRSEVWAYLKFVDSVKVSVNSVVLNEAGDKKVMDSLVKDKAAGVGPTFFLEYQIPEVLVRNHQKNKSKVDSGLDSGNVVRLCSRRSHLQAISFKSVSIHDVNLNRIKLEDAVITFRLSFRNFKQKTPILLGVAKFNFHSFEVSKNFTCNQELTIRLNENTPIVVGGLKVSIQLGCGKLYFGKEFIDAITNNKENEIALGSDDLSSNTDSDVIDKVLDYYSQHFGEKRPAFQNVVTQKSKPQPQVPKLNLVSSKFEFQGPQSYSRKPEAYFRHPESVSRKPEPYSREFEFVSRQPESYSRQPESYSRQSESYSRQPESYSRQPEFVSRQPEPYSRKPAPYSRHPLSNSRKTEPISRKPESVSRQPESVSRQPESVSRQTESVAQQPESYSRKPEYISRKPESVSRKPEPYSRHPESNSRKPESVSLQPGPISRKTESRESNWFLSCAKPVLFGFVYISEAHFSREVMNSYLTCQIFTSDDTCSSKLVPFDSNPIYNFSQRIPIVCDDDFLLKLRENFMIVEFCEKGQKDFLIGLTKLPLHQFYLAYRNPIIVKYLSDGRLPVIGTDGWETIYKPSDGEVVGQAQFLVALGTQEQIENLEKERGLKNDTVKVAQNSTKTIDIGVQYSMEAKNDIELLLKQVDQKEEEQADSGEVVSEVRSTSDLLDSLQKALSIDVEEVTEKTWFRAHVAINSALHLPSRRKCKSRRNKGRNGKVEDILPSTYVTFEDYKSELNITQIIPKSTSPKWEYKRDVSLPLEYLTDNQKLLVFKVWRKSTNTTMTPNLAVDHVIGFAAVDLTVLAAGLPSVQGWYNINDLSKKANGQINIHVTPLENVQRYQSKKSNDVATPPELLPQAPFEPEELLGRALKRKFSELDEITQRLRLRLSKVTDESDASNDELADEFERDINTLCIEDDFDMVNFEKEGRSFNKDDEVALLKTDKRGESKKIDQLLEKLSLISGEASSRYVSGCSEGRVDVILEDLDCHSRPNLYSGGSFNREMVQKFGEREEGFEGREVPEGDGGCSTDSNKYD